jgi:predicted nucleotidyltransferase
MDDVDDDELPRYLAERLSSVGGVEAVALGGSRSTGAHQISSDWDFGLYYRGELDTDAIRALGWPGTVFGHPPDPWRHGL